MTRPWRCVDSAPTAEGELRCLQRGDGDFMITVAGRVLMVSHAARSEEALARLAREALGQRPRARVLVGGLGMGYTLRAALDAWPDASTVVVCELNPVVVKWCRGPLAELSANALQDPRVQVEVDDVAALIRRCGAKEPATRFDAILLDLYEGPKDALRQDAVQRAHYSERALQEARAALRPGGVLAIWSEEPDTPFEHRLRAVGLSLRRHHPDRTARRHTVYVACRG